MEIDEQPTLESLDNRIRELEEDIQSYTTFVQHYIETRRKYRSRVLINIDELIEDVDNTVTQEEVDRLIAYEKGNAMRLTIQRMDGTSFCRWYGFSLRCSSDCV